ncbi:MAG TPA: hypothetical protein VG797_10985 [Phycisphaerales bacterium]|nr:hypothetical protein [Phycisphaerales bacterium]
MTMREGPSHQQSPLNERDRAAVDALVTSGFATAASQASPARPASRLLSLLGPHTPASANTPALLSSGLDSDRRAAMSLIELTMARVLRERSTEANTVAGKVGDDHTTAPLSVEDAHAIDELVEGVWAVGAGNDRGSKAATLLALLNSDVPASSRSSLIGGTLARVESSIDAEHGRLRLQQQASPNSEHIAAAPRNKRSLRGGFSFRLSDLAGIAAILVVGTAVMWPKVSTYRDETRQVAVTGNLEGASVGGVDRYSKDRAGSTQAGFFDRSWWDAPQDRSRSISASPIVQQPAGPLRLVILRETPAESTTAESPKAGNGSVMFLFRPVAPATPR